MKTCQQCGCDTEENKCSICGTDRYLKEKESS